MKKHKWTTERRQRQSEIMKTQAWVTRRKNGNDVAYNRKEIPKEVLYQKYITEGKSTHKIAEELDTNQTHVRRWMKRHGIKSRSRSEILKKNWKKSSYIRTQMKARNRTTQNKQEKQLHEILDELFPEMFSFVGDGSVIIDSKCPDFIHEDSKTIVEFFGRYWHPEEDESSKIEHYRKNGYSCIIVWDDELSDLEELKNKLCQNISTD